MQNRLLPRERVLAIQETRQDLFMSKSSNQMVNSTMLDIFLIEVVNIASMSYKTCCTSYVYIYACFILLHFSGESHFL
jgi:hypothetical protein